MASVAQSPYTKEQISAWLRGLLTIAWCDGDYDLQEQKLIADLTKDLSVDDQQTLSYQSIEPEELANALGDDVKTGENFLRTAVLVAIADGIYSTPEAELLHQYSEALGLKIEALNSLEHTLCKPNGEEPQAQVTGNAAPLVSPPQPQADLL
ncbi:MAG: tellurite resistance TerB family protein, partial [Flavobacteriaceae bacterium]|nr:tellurite resistance TerB family protein [Flavobacteriaceae bacterium]